MKASAYARLREQSATRRCGLLVGVLIGHAVAIWGLINAFNVQLAASAAPPIEVRIVPPEQRVPAPAPLLHPRLAAVVIADVIAPELKIDIPPDRPPPPPQPAAKTPSPTPMMFLSAPQDPMTYYPLVSRRHGEQGAVLTKVCVDATDKIASVAIIRSSGIQRLDAAAVALAGHSVWKLATVAGKPIPGCGYQWVEFNLSQLREPKGSLK